MDEVEDAEYGAVQYGSVHLQDYMPMPDGALTRVITGYVSVKEALDTIGLKVSRSESNWFAIIKGDTTTAYVPGCQVRAITHHSPEMHLAGDVYKMP